MPEYVAKNSAFIKIVISSPPTRGRIFFINLLHHLLPNKWWPQTVCKSQGGQQGVDSPSSMWWAGQQWESFTYWSTRSKILSEKQSLDLTDSSIAWGSTLMLCKPSWLNTAISTNYAFLSGHTVSVFYLIGMLVFATPVVKIEMLYHRWLHCSITRHPCE